MQNLDQIRAKNALAAAQSKKRDRNNAETNQFEFVRADVAGFPALIIQNGLLAAFAYASEEGKTTRAGIKFACDRTAAHLAEHGIDVLRNQTTSAALIDALSRKAATSLDLQRATSEVLAFFSYLKRFAAKEQPRQLGA